MVSMKTQSDRTLFFDLLPLDLGEIMGFKTRFLLYTVPGQVFYNATRKLVLKGADAIVFVADSEVGKMEENKDSLANLKANLAEYKLSLDDTPWVIQYNKRDLPNAAPIRDLQAALNPGWEVADASRMRLMPDPFHAGEHLIEQLGSGEWVERAPYFDAVAVTGEGVFDTLKAVSKLVLKSLA